MTLPFDEMARQSSEPEARGRPSALIVSAALVLILTSLIVLGGEHVLEVAFLTVAALAIPRTIQALRHPGRGTRLQTGHEFDPIIERGGLELAPTADGASTGGARLAIQDALDAIAEQRRSPMVGRSGARWLSVWSLVCVAGAIAVLMFRDDPAGVAALALGAAALAGLSVYARRLGRRLQAAEETLLKQMRSLMEETGEAALPGGEIE